MYFSQNGDNYKVKMDNEDCFKKLWADMNPNLPDMFVNTSSQLMEIDKCMPWEDEPLNQSLSENEPNQQDSNNANPTKRFMPDELLPTRPMPTQVAPPNKYRMMQQRQMMLLPLQQQQELQQQQQQQLMAAHPQQQAHSLDTNMFKPTESSQKMITHLLWPRFLPQHEHYDLKEHETALVELMIDVVDWFQKKCIVGEHVSKLMKSFHRIKTSTSPEVISNEISRLEPGQMTAMYIKAQNACLLLYMRPGGQDNGKKRLIASTFPVQLDAEEIADYPRSDVTVLIFLVFTNIYLRIF